jgi:ABC-2 type transport system permease protein
VAAAYVAFGFTALLALGTLFSTLTDGPAGAIGATVGVYIVSEILDGISELGVIRYGFPTHYLDAWQTMFLENRYSPDMIAGVIVQLAYLVVFGAAAIAWFNRKDISS